MIQDYVRCFRCGTHPQHIDVIRTSDTGVQTVQFECVNCGYRYRWAYRELPTEAAMPVNEQPIPPSRLRKLRLMEGGNNAGNQHQAR